MTDYKNVQVIKGKAQLAANTWNKNYVVHIDKYGNCGYTEQQYLRRNPLKNGTKVLDVMEPVKSQVTD